jgi:hypothetical protein
LGVLAPKKEKTMFDPDDYELHEAQMPRPTYIAPSSAIELDTALDKERLGLDGARPSTPVGWSDTDWIKHLQDQEPHPLADCTSTRAA